VPTHRKYGQSATANDSMKDCSHSLRLPDLQARAALLDRLANLYLLFHVLTETATSFTPIAKRLARDKHVGSAMSWMFSRRRIDQHTHYR